MIEDEGRRRPALAVSAVTKSYGRFTALSDLSLTVDRGEIVAMIGANGAGKSTFIKIISGVERRSGGTIDIGDQTDVEFRGPADAAACGIGVVHQELPLLPNLTAAENVALGLTRQSLVGRGRTRALNRRYDEVAAMLPGAPPATARLDALSLFHWQLVAIIRAIASNAEVLVLDEPTSSLNTTERGALHELLHSLAAEGMAIVYVTHFLDDALEVADRVLVLKDGATVFEGPARDQSAAGLLEHMSGERLTRPSRADVSETASEVVLRVDDLTAVGLGPISLVARRGECVGLYGLEGCGASALLEALFGLVSGRGAVLVDEGVVGRGPRRRILRGVGLVTSERRRTVFPEWTVAENYILPHYTRAAFLSVPRFAATQRAAARGIESFSIKAAPSQRARTLSGGNQQKMLVARWATIADRVLLMDQPTHGVDVRGRMAIHEKTRAMVREGRAVVAFSTDPEEIVAIADRVLVMAQGVVIAELTGPDIAVDRLEEITRVRSHAGAQ